MSVPGRVQRWIGWGLALAAMSASAGMALQKKGGGGSGTGASTPTLPPASSNYPASNYPPAVGRGGFPMGDTAPDLDMRATLEEKRSKLVNVERQKTMEREATQLARLAAELQQSMDRGPQGGERDEAVRRADTIERLAHNVKERMKGAR